MKTAVGRAFGRVTTLAAMFLIAGAIGAIEGYVVRRQLDVGQGEADEAWRAKLEEQADEWRMMIGSWAGDRLSDSRVVASYPAVAELLAGQPAQGGGAAASRDSTRRHVETVIDSFIRLKGYHSALVVDRAGTPVATAGEPGSVGLTGRVGARLSENRRRSDRSVLHAVRNRTGVGGGCQSAWCRGAGHRVRDPDLRPARVAVPAPAQGPRPLRDGRGAARRCRGRKAGLCESPPVSRASLVNARASDRIRSGRSRGCNQVDWRFRLPRGAGAVSHPAGPCNAMDPRRESGPPRGAGDEQRAEFPAGPAGSRAPRRPGRVRRGHPPAPARSSTTGNSGRRPRNCGSSTASSGRSRK